MYLQLTISILSLTIFPSIIHGVQSPVVTIYEFNVTEITLLDSVPNSDLLVPANPENTTDRYLVLQCKAPYPIQWIYSGDGIPEYIANTSVSWAVEPVEFTASAGIFRLAEHHTGNYTCRSIQNSNWAVSYYLYITGDNLFTASGGEAVIYSRNDISVRIPCSVSNPHVRVTLQKLVNGYINCPLNDTIKFDKKKGFMLEITDDYQPEGDYVCIASYKGIYKFVEYLVLSEMSLEQDNSSPSGHHPDFESPNIPIPSRLPTTTKRPLPTTTVSNLGPYRRPTDIPASPSKRPSGSNHHRPTDVPASPGKRPSGSNHRPTDVPASPGKRPSGSHHRPTDVPASPNKRPSGSNHKPSGSNHGPSGSNHGPSGSNHGPSGSNHGPSGSNHGPSGSNHGPSGSNHGPSGSNHGPSGSNHGRPGSNHKPSGSNHRPTDVPASPSKRPSGSHHHPGDVPASPGNRPSGSHQRPTDYPGSPPNGPYGPPDRHPADRPPLTIYGQNCDSFPCGRYAYCQLNSHDMPVCKCERHFHGNPYDICHPECIVDIDCPSNRVCHDNACEDPCPQACGPAIESLQSCKVINHTTICNYNHCNPSPCGPYSKCEDFKDTAECSCLPGYFGHPPYCTPNAPSTPNIRTTVSDLGSLRPTESVPESPSGFDEDEEGPLHLKFQCRAHRDCDINLRCIENKCLDPCSPNPCGRSTICRVTNHEPICSCAPGFIKVNQYCLPTNCRSQRDCPESKSCVRNKCINPCAGYCGRNSDCTVQLHTPKCACSSGYTGNPAHGCTRIKAEIDYTPDVPNSPLDTVKFVTPLPTPGVVQPPVNSCGICGRNAKCLKRVCKCNVGYSGDPYRFCYQIIAIPQPAIPDSEETIEKELGFHPESSTFSTKYLFTSAVPAKSVAAAGVFHRVGSNPGGASISSTETDLEFALHDIGTKYTAVEFVNTPNSKETNSDGDPSGFLSDDTDVGSQRVMSSESGKYNENPSKLIISTTSKFVDSVISQLNNPGISQLPNSGNIKLPNAGTIKLSNAGTTKLPNSGNTKLPNSGSSKLPNPGNSNLANLSKLTNPAILQFTSSSKSKLNNSAIVKQSIPTSASAYGFSSTIPSVIKKGYDCLKSDDCSAEKTCLASKCLDPCMFFPICGENQECQVIHHKASCVCKPGYPVKIYNNCYPAENYTSLALCNPSPCGINEDCNITDSGSICRCKKGMIGYPPNCQKDTTAKIKCAMNSDCHDLLACMDGKCSDPCENTCGYLARCRVYRHEPKCFCPQGFYGNPRVSCSAPLYNSRFTSNTESRHAGNKIRNSSSEGPWDDSAEMFDSDEVSHGTEAAGFVEAEIGATEAAKLVSSESSMASSSESDEKDYINVPLKLKPSKSAAVASKSAAAPSKSPPPPPPPPPSIAPEAEKKRESIARHDDEYFDDSNEFPNLYSQFSHTRRL